MKKIGLFVFVVVVLFSFACEKKVTEWRRIATGTISGTALLADTSDHRSIIIEFLPDNQDYTIRTHPDSSGFYSVPDLPVGTYSARGEKYAYIPFEQTGVVVEDGKTTEVDMLLTRASTQFVFDSFESELYYYLDEEDSTYWNKLRYKVRFHFENFDGAWNWWWERYGNSGWGGSSGGYHFLEAGQIDSTSGQRGSGSSNPDWLLPPDTTVSVEVRVEGLVLMHENFDTTGAIYFEASTLDSVTVIDGRPPDWPQLHVSDQSLYRLDE